MNNNKKNINISNRLLECAKRVSKNSKIVDVGSDHAHLPIYLCLNKIISYAIACDINIGPLEISKKNIKKYNLENLICTRISDGLKNIQDTEVNEVIIAGMGGNLISNILDKSLKQNKKFKKYILQPVQHESNLREYLCNSGFEITYENIIESDKKIYLIMEAIYSNKKYSLSDLEKYIGTSSFIKNIDKSQKKYSVYLNKKINSLYNQKKGAQITKNFELEEYCEKLINKINSNQI